LKEKFNKGGRLKNLKNLLLVKAFGLYLRGLYNYYRFLLGNKSDPLKSQKLLASYASQYYNPRLSGGEGHMEVGKHIYMIKHKKAHMVVSVKPFGCMPSTQSDGVQSKVMEDLGGSLFVAVETSGDAEANVKSRVLMTLYEAKVKAMEEFERAKFEKGVSDRDIERALRSRKYRNPLLKLPHKFVSTAANAVLTL